MACLPAKIRSNVPTVLMPAATALEVAQVSEPPSALSDNRTASSAPIARHSLSISLACGGPIVTTTTSVSGWLSLTSSACSKALASSGLRMDGTPSLIRVPVSGLILISVVSGTCLTHTMIFIFYLLFTHALLCSYRPMLPEMTILCTSEVPS